MRRIDLLPERYRARRRERRNIGIIAAAALFALLLLLLWWFSLGASINSANDDLAAAQSRNAALQAQIAELQRFADLDAEVRAKQQALQTVFAGDIAWPRLLTEIAMVVPGEVWLTGMNASAGATEGASPVGTETAPIRISQKQPFGRIQFQGSSVSFPGIAKWLLRLGQVDEFSAVWLNSATDQSGGSTVAGPTVITFDSTLELSEDAVSGRYQGRLP